MWGGGLRLIGAERAWRIPLTQMVGGVGSEAGKISGVGEDPYPRLSCGTLAIVNSDVLV